MIQTQPATTPVPDPSLSPHDVPDPVTPPVAVPAPAADATPVVLLEQASHAFADDVGVFDVSLAVPPATILGVVGPSGAGKTTTIRLITGALEPTAGRIQVLGEQPSRFSRATRERIGYLPQQFSLYPDLTAQENVDFVASLFGMLYPRRRRRVREALRLVELDDVRNRRAGRLSGGQQRRLDLACALVHEPDLLLLDEPTAGIDPILRQAIWAELHRLKGEGRTILVTTQYLTEAEACDAVALIAHGRLAAIGAPEALRREAAGGDVVEGRTERPFDPATLIGEGGIRTARSTGLRTFKVGVDDAARVIPVLPDLVEQRGGQLVAAREARLTFDEVFATLVERSAPEPEDAAWPAEPAESAESRP